MPVYCPACRDEYHDGCSTCADCGVALVATLSEATRLAKDAKASAESARRGAQAAEIGDALESRRVLEDRLDTRRLPPMVEEGEPLVRLCASCINEYRPEVDRCAECGAELQICSQRFSRALSAITPPEGETTADYLQRILEAPARRTALGSTPAGSGQVISLPNHTSDARGDVAPDKG